MELPDGSAMRSIWRRRHVQSAPTRPIDRIDDRGRPKGRDDVGQMLDVLDVDVDQHLEEVGIAAGDLQVGDVPAVLADHGREGAEAAGLISPTLVYEDGSIFQRDLARRLHDRGFGTWSSRSVDFWMLEDTPPAADAMARLLETVDSALLGNTGTTASGARFG